MVRQLGAYRLIRGYRDYPPLDEEALVDLIVRVADLFDRDLHLAEFDLNPVVLYETGTMVVDARLYMDDTPVEVPCREPEAVPADLFLPRAIAVVGASADPAKSGTRPSGTCSRTRARSTRSTPSGTRSSGGGPTPRSRPSRPGRDGRHRGPGRARAWSDCGGGRRRRPAGRDPLGRLSRVGRGGPAPRGAGDGERPGRRDPRGRAELPGDHAPAVPGSTRPSTRSRRRPARSRSSPSPGP